jgi:hypothetical protein
MVDVRFIAQASCHEFWKSVSKHIPEHRQEAFLTTGRAVIRPSKSAKL